jgi:hypothetical protein
VSLVIVYFSVILSMLLLSSEMKRNLSNNSLNLNTFHSHYEDFFVFFWIYHPQQLRHVSLSLNFNSYTSSL